MKLMSSASALALRRPLEAGDIKANCFSEAEQSVFSFTDEVMDSAVACLTNWHTSDHGIWHSRMG
jgi:hypothetical protein